MKETELNNIVHAKLNEFQLLNSGEINSDWDKELFIKLELSKAKTFSKSKVQIALFVLVILINLVYAFQKIEMYKHEKTQQVLNVVSNELLINEIF